MSIMIVSPLDVADAVAKAQEALEEDIVANGGADAAEDDEAGATVTTPAIVAPSSSASSSQSGASPQQRVVVESNPFEEIDNALLRVPDVPSFEKAAEKSLVLIDVLHRYLIPCLMATPLVYMSDEKWDFHNHAEFRAAQRKELEDLRDTLSANLGGENLKTILPNILDRLESVFLEVLKVRLPAMPSIYLTENFYDTVPVKEAFGELTEKVQRNKRLDIRTRVYTLSQLLIQFLLYCPVGRPQIYVNDTEWKLESERTIRASLREAIFRR